MTSKEVDALIEMFLKADLLLLQNLHRIIRDEDVRLITVDCWQVLYLYKDESSVNFIYAIGHSSDRVSLSLKRKYIGDDLVEFKNILTEAILMLDL